MILGFHCTNILLPRRVPVQVHLKIWENITIMFLFIQITTRLDVCSQELNYSNASFLDSHYHICFSNLGPSQHKKSFPRGNIWYYLWYQTQTWYISIAFPLISVTDVRNVGMVLRLPYLTRAAFVRPSLCVVSVAVGTRIPRVTHRELSVCVTTYYCSHSQPVLCFCLRRSEGGFSGMGQS